MLAQADVAILDLAQHPDFRHRAYLDPGETWNGCARPYFESQEVWRMGAWLDGETISYDSERDIFRIGSDETGYEEFAGVDIEGMHLYPIGSGSWLWGITDMQESPIDTAFLANSGFDETRSLNNGFASRDCSDLVL